MRRRLACRPATRFRVMASLRQYVCLLIVSLLLTTVLLLTFLSPSGQWTLALLCPPEHATPASGVGGCSQAREKRPPAGLAAWWGEGGCRGLGVVPVNYTSEELGLMGGLSTNVTRKRGNPKQIPDLKTRIAAVLKSRNPCQRSEERGSGLACLPYYYLAGFPKCGSTDLYLRLTSHPHIVRHRPGRKELHWVSKGRFLFPQGRSEAVESYKHLLGTTLLADAMPVEDLPKAIIGDHSVSTVWDNSQWRHIPANVHCSRPRALTADVVRHLTPRAKVMVIVRNPTDRLYSAHLFFSPNSTKQDFHRQALHDVREATRCFQQNGVRPCVYDLLSNLTLRLQVGLYYVYIADWLQRFPRDQLHVIRLEDMAERGEEELERAFAFLGVDIPDREWTRAVLSRPVVGAGSRVRQQGPMLRDTRRLLVRFYRPFNRRLAALLHHSKFQWLDT